MSETRSDTGTGLGKEYDAFCDSVDAALRAVYGISAGDAGVDDVMLIQAIEAGDTPEQFVSWFGRKYDLGPISERWDGVTPTCPHCYETFTHWSAAKIHVKYCTAGASPRKRVR